VANPFFIASRVHSRGRKEHSLSSVVLFPPMVGGEGRLREILAVGAIDALAGIAL